MLKLTHQDIRHVAGGSTFDRGENYFAQGAVVEGIPEVIDSEYVILRSKVSVSGSTFLQEIGLEASGTFGIHIDGICSCSVGFNCEHVVAACLFYSDTANADPAEQLAVKLDWVNNLKRAGQPESVSADEEFIAYILDEGFRSNDLKVRYVACKFNNNGARTKGRKLGQHALVNRLSSATQADVQINRMLGAFDSIGGYADEYGISGELGQLCLSRMIGTGRCFWQETKNPPLSFGAARALRVDWQAMTDDNLQLKLAVKPAAKVLNLFPPHYLDQEIWCIGSISDANFNNQEWQLLHEAPRLTQNEVDSFSEHLFIEMPESPLPLPGKVDPIKIVGQLPVPLLRIDTVQQLATTHHRISLKFKYQHVEIPVHPVTPVVNLMESGGVLSIHRNLETEYRFRQQLQRLGLKENTQSGVDCWLGFDSGQVQSVPDVRVDEIDRWRLFLKETVPLLKADGWLIEVSPDFSLSFVEVDKWEASLEPDSDQRAEERNDWFDLRFDLQVQGEKYALLPLITQILHQYDLDQLPPILSVAISGHTYLELPSERVRPICNILYELYDQAHQSASKPVSNEFRLEKYDAVKLRELDQAMGSDIVWRGGASMRELASKLDNFQGVVPVETARGLKASLRTYQKRGVDWLQFLRQYSFHGILADEMGLGKTVQVLAHLQIEKERKRMDRPCLIVAPTSLMSNWRREVKQFAPDLSVLVLQGGKRQDQFGSISHYDLVVTTYPLLVRDQAALLDVAYHYIVLDEAQVIKNHNSQAAQLVRQLRSRHRLCMTGTPMENHLGELWSQFDFLMPGFLGDSATFRKRFRTPIENHGNQEQHVRLSKRIAPFLLRRRKKDVAKELPAKTEIIRTVALGNEQAALYESIRLSMEKKVRDAIAAQGLARSHITILDALLKLRQTCCDPRLLSLNEASAVTTSAKLELLMQMLPEMLEEGRRVLLFSQFTTMLGLIEQSLEAQNIIYTKLTGQTQNRDAAIEKFRQGDANVFLISLKAGGVGLNLTEADTVIHYDPWWNPAAENQATDRAHRIGQDKPVFVYKLITENTLEEKILDMQVKKQLLAEGSYEFAKQGDQLQISLDELQLLLT